MIASGGGAKWRGPVPAEGARRGPLASPARALLMVALYLGEGALRGLSGSPVLALGDLHQGGYCLAGPGTELPDGLSGLRAVPIANAKGATPYLADCRYTTALPGRSRLISPEHIAGHAGSEAQHPVRGKAITHWHAGCLFSRFAVDKASSFVTVGVEYA